MHTLHHIRGGSRPKSEGGQRLYQGGGRDYIRVGAEGAETISGEAGGGAGHI